MNYTPGAYADAVLHAVDVQDGFSLVQLLALSSFHGKHGQTPSEIVSQHVRNYNVSCDKRLFCDCLTSFLRRRNVFRFPSRNVKAT